MRLKLILTIFISVFFLVGVSHAATYYASPTGGGVKDGSKAAPFDIASITWTSFEAGAEDHTLYLFGGTYTTQMLIRHNSETNTLYIKPCSASPLPSDCDSQVVFQSASGGEALGMLAFNGGSSLAKYVTIDGETTSGAGTRNIKIVPLDGRGISLPYETTHISLRYLEITGLDDDETPKVYGNAPSSAVTGIYGLSVGSGSEVAYCYFHDNWGTQDLFWHGDKTAYGNLAIHHNTFETGTLNYVSTGGGVDIYNNIFDASDAIYPYDILHILAIEYVGNTGIQNLRIFNNFFDSEDQMNFLENATTTCCDGGPCKTEHIRIYNNVYTSTNRVNGTSRSVMIKNSSAGADVDDLIIANNTFADVKIGILFQGGASNATVLTGTKIVNNIFYENSTNAYYDNSAAIAADNLVSWVVDADCLLSHNLLYDNDSISIEWPDSAGGTWTFYTTIVGINAVSAGTNLEGDPLFAESINWTLGALSTSAINAGLDVGAYTNMDSLWPKDKAGTSRPQGAAWDMGAYEYRTVPNISNLGTGAITITPNNAGAITITPY